MQPVFADAPYYGDTTCETLFDRGLCLPSGSGLKEEELRYVADKIKRVFQQIANQKIIIKKLWLKSKK